jgi:glycosyltransferase involved in cell wall biosynthesis
VAYEVIVVDNNSTDATQTVVAEAVGSSGRRPAYVFEARQGVSYARNAGTARARAPIVAFCDDDVLVAPNWVETIRRRLSRHGEVACVGGKVLARYEAALPEWLTREHWSPLAIQDFGDEPIVLDASSATGLVSANLAFRTAVLAEVGGFSPELQRTPDVVSAMEDRELITRVKRSGRTALYAPDVVVTAVVPAERLSKAYHRRWHREHGMCYAAYRDEEMERSRAGRLFDVPTHLYRTALGDAVSWGRRAAAGDIDGAFSNELRLRFFAGFFGRRFRDWRRGAAEPSAK